MGLSGILNGDEDDLLAKERSAWSGPSSGMRLVWREPGTPGEGTSFPDRHDDEHQCRGDTERERAQQQAGQRDQCQQP